MKPWRDKNFGLHPSDQEYRTDYNKDEDYERYLDEVERKEEARKGN